MAPLARLDPPALSVVHAGLETPALLALLLEDTVVGVALLRLQHAVLERHVRAGVADFLLEAALLEYAVVNVLRARRWTPEKCDSKSLPLCSVLARVVWSILYSPPSFSGSRDLMSL